MSSFETEIRDAAYKRFLEEKDAELRAAFLKREEEERQQAEKERAIREQLILLKQQEEEIRLRAEKAVLEEEARQLALKKEEALQKELERLRNRSPLEVLQDELAELKAGLAVLSDTADLVKKLQTQLDDVKAGLVALAEKKNLLANDEIYIGVWPLLLDWNQKIRDIETTRYSWATCERNIITNQYFSGKIDGCQEEFFQTDAVEKMLLAAQEEFTALQSKYLLHKPMWENARDELAKKNTEYYEANNKYTPFTNRHGIGSIHDENTYNNFMRMNPIVAAQYSSMNYQQFKEHKNMLEENMKTKKAGMEAAQTIEAAAKKSYDAEMASWNGSKERTDSSKHCSDLGNLKGNIAAAKTHLQRLNVSEKELEELEERIANITGEREIERVYKKAIQIMRKRRM